MGNEPWVHGTRLGRQHASVRQHLAEDHGVQAQYLAVASDGAVHGLHDTRHRRTWAYGYNLPHGPAVVGPVPRLGDFVLVPGEKARRPGDQERLV